jgi:hypothetical protein
MRTDAIPTQKLPGTETKGARSCEEARDGGAKKSNRSNRGRGNARENGRDEKREEIAQLSDAQIAMQIPTDRQRGRWRKGGDEAVTFFFTEESISRLLPPAP